MQPASSKKLLLLLALVFLLRIAFALGAWKINGPSAFISPDTGNYLFPAQSLLHGAFLSDGSYCIRNTPDIFRTPGYPVFLIPAIFFGHTIILALLQNFLLSVASAWIIWKIVTEYAPDSSAAFWAVLLFCFEPVGFLHSERILSETLFTTLLLLFVWIFLRFLRVPDYTKLIWSALVLACAAYVRPVPLYLGLLLIPLLLAFFPRTLPWKQRVFRAVLFPVLFLFMLVPWVLRNSRVADYQGFSTASAWNLYFLSAGAVQAKLEHRGLSQVMADADYVDAEHYIQARPDMHGWSQGQVARFWDSEAKKTIRSHPFLYAVIHAKGCAMVLFNPGVTELLRNMGLYPMFESPLTGKLEGGYLQTTIWLVRKYPISAIAVLLMLAQLFLCYFGALDGLRRLPFSAACFIVTVFVYFVLVSGIPAAQARYRAPIMPLVCVCAGLAIASRAKYTMTVAAAQG